mmetsp:Transcript_9446/g.23169  ORF Transcript_9446/g.23169 Transcript_9446/m.23169 type:complete len:204 (-) Transcript_9446:599-1210(-)
MATMTSSGFARTAAGSESHSSGVEISRSSMASLTTSGSGFASTAAGSDTDVQPVFGIRSTPTPTLSRCLRMASFTTSGFSRAASGTESHCSGVEICRSSMATLATSGVAQAGSEFQFKFGRFPSRIAASNLPTRSFSGCASGWPAECISATLFLAAMLSVFSIKAPSPVPRAPSRLAAASGGTSGKMPLRFFREFETAIMRVA